MLPGANIGLGLADAIETGTYHRLGGELSGIDLANDLRRLNSLGVGFVFVIGFDHPPEGCGSVEAPALSCCAALSPVS